MQSWIPSHETPTRAAPIRPRGESPAPFADFVRRRRRTGRRAGCDLGRGSPGSVAPPDRKPSSGGGSPGAPSAHRTANPASEVVTQKRRSIGAQLRDDGPARGQGNRWQKKGPARSEPLAGLHLAPISGIRREPAAPPRQLDVQQAADADAHRVISRPRARCQRQPAAERADDPTENPGRWLLESAQQFRPPAQASDRRAGGQPAARLARRFQRQGQSHGMAASRPRFPGGGATQRYRRRVAQLVESLRSRPHEFRPALLRLETRPPPSPTWRRS